MIELLLINLNTLLRANYYDETIFDKFKYFIKMIELLLKNLNILLKSDYYGKTIVEKFEYFH
jgi:hypothetical protein